MRTLCAMLIAGAALGSWAAGQDLSGTWAASQDGARYSLSLQQAGDGTLTGTLTLGNGSKVALSGTAEQGEAGGTGSAQGAEYYFEAEVDNGGLAFMLVPSDDEGMPDFENAVQLTFSKGAAASSPAARPSRAEPEEPEIIEEKARQLETGITSPGWGFSFQAPRGWRYKVQAGGAIVGHDSVVGMILVLPHSARTLAAMKAEMQAGLKEEDGQLVLSGELKSSGEDRLSGDYTGTWQGEAAKARGIGTLSPYGGGAYVIAAATPEKFSIRLSQAGLDVARSMKYKRETGSGLVQHFAGTWYNCTKNTETYVHLVADGTYAENYEASYSGSSSDGLGNQDLSWGTARNDNTSGRWTVRGTREQGVLTITYENGNRREIEYRVHVENGETYWSEYYFNGELYGKK